MTLCQPCAESDQPLPGEKWCDGCDLTAARKTIKTLREKIKKQKALLDYYGATVPR